MPSIRPCFLPSSSPLKFPILSPSWPKKGSNAAENKMLRQILRQEVFDKISIEYSLQEEASRNHETESTQGATGQNGRA